MALTAAGLWAPRHAHAGDISLSDRIDLLYSNQFHFNQRGEPQITVGLMEGQDRGAADRPRPDPRAPVGDGGTSIEGGRRWLMKLGKGAASRQRWAIALESISATDGRAIQAATKKWKARGFTTREHEVGALFGVRGKVLDTRRIMLTTGDYASEAEADKQARILRQRHGALGRLHPTIEKRSKGTVIAHDLDHDVKIRAEGVLWFAPRAGESITVHDVQYGTTIGKSGRETRSYRGEMYVALDRSGKLTVVNLVSETDLLAGLVPAEIFASAPHEALKPRASRPAGSC